MKQAIIIAIIILITSGSTTGQEHTIKFATLAPEGTTWMNVMREYDKTIRQESGGRLGFKIFAGSVQGDEIDVIRKIRLGQLHSAGFTGNGITTIAPKVRILDSPFLFRSYDEVDHIYTTFEGEFTKAFEEGGYVLLGWAEVGFVYVFTKSRVETPADMKGVKMWMWEGDPVAEASFRALGLQPIPLSITDVLTSLQTGLIDGIYTSPLASIALQWFTRVKYLLNLPLADAAGAVVISKKKFDELSPDLQEILLRNGRKYMKKLTALSREDNVKAMQTLKNQGIISVDPEAPDVRTTYEETGRRARQMLINKLYGEDFQNRIERTIEEFRTRHHGTGK